MLQPSFNAKTVASAGWKTRKDNKYLLLCLLQESGLSHVPGLTAVRSLPAPMSWLATTAPTRERRSLSARCATSVSCAATTWWSTPAATLTSSQACWSGPTAAVAAAAASRVQVPSATTAAQMPPAPPSAPPSAQPARLKLKPCRTFCLWPGRPVFLS